MPAVVALMQWGDQWASAGNPPIVAADDDGQPVMPVGLKSAGETVNAGTIRFHPGSGATAHTRSFLDELSQSR